MGLMALITHAIGVHTVLGAFVAGILVGQSPILTRHIDEQLRGLIIASFHACLFWLGGVERRSSRCWQDPSLLLLAARLYCHCQRRQVQRGVSRRRGLSGLTWRESLALGCGYERSRLDRGHRRALGLSMGALSQDLFARDRDHGDSHDDGNAADAALGARAAAAPARREGADRTRRVRSTRLCQQCRALLVAVDEGAVKLSRDLQGCYPAREGSPALSYNSYPPPPPEMAGCRPRPPRRSNPLLRTRPAPPRSRALTPAPPWAWSTLRRGCKRS